MSSVSNLLLETIFSKKSSKKWRGFFKRKNDDLYTVLLLLYSTVLVSIKQILLSQHEFHL